MKEFGKGAEGMSREARPAWAEALMFLARALVTSCMAHLPPNLCLLAQEGPSQPRLPNPT